MKNFRRRLPVMFVVVVFIVFIAGAYKLESRIPQPSSSISQNPASNTRF